MAKKMVNIRLDESVWQRAKVAAVSEGVTLQDWLTLAILFKVAQEKKEPVEVVK